MKAFLFFVLLVLCVQSYSGCDNITGFNSTYLDFTYWDNVLQRHVSPSQISGINLNVVDYSAVKHDIEFTFFQCQLEKTNLTGFTYHQWYAFWINAYNFLAVHAVVTHPCNVDFAGECGSLLSIRNVGDFQPSFPGDPPVWNEPRLKIALSAKPMSLNDIEHQRLRNGAIGGFPLEDPSLHACIVCASVSCPNLRDRAYTAENITAEMADNTRDFLSNNKKGLSVGSDGEVTLSPIFNWFNPDFNGGRTNIPSKYKKLTEFLLDHVTDNATRDAINNQAGVIDGNTFAVFGYDWNLNGNTNDICDSDRICLFSGLSLAITGGVILLIVIITIIVCVCCCRRRTSYSSVK